MALDNAAVAGMLAPVMVALPLIALMAMNSIASKDGFNAASCVPAMITTFVVAATMSVSVLFKDVLKYTNISAKAAAYTKAAVALAEFVSAAYSYVSSMTTNGACGRGV